MGSRRDYRRDYSQWPHGGPLGSVWTSDWDSACSELTDKFELIINCTDKPIQYGRWMY